MRGRFGRSRGSQGSRRWQGRRRRGVFEGQAWFGSRRESCVWRLAWAAGRLGHTSGRRYGVSMRSKCRQRVKLDPVFHWDVGRVFRRYTARTTPMKTDGGPAISPPAGESPWTGASAPVSNARSRKKTSNPGTISKPAMNHAPALSRPTMSAMLSGEVKRCKVKDVAARMRSSELATELADGACGRVVLAGEWFLRS